MCYTLGCCFSAKPNLQIKMNATPIACIRVLNSAWHLAPSVLSTERLGKGQGQEGADELMGSGGQRAVSGRVGGRCENSKINRDSD